MERITQSIVIGIEPHSERFTRIHLFEPDVGYICCLKRISSRKISHNNLDLFQTIEIMFQQKTEHDIGFIKEFTIVHSRDEIGKNYHTFDFASKFCRVIHLNAKNMPHPHEIYDLIRLSLDSWNQKKQPHVVFFKALYKLAFEDGFPVKEDWLLKQSKEDVLFAKNVIYQPIDAQDTSSEKLSPQIDNLIHWLSYQQDFRF